MKRKKNFLAIAAPSGGGKTTLCKLVLDKYREFVLSISYTSRKPRGNEKHGRDYFFISHEQFKKMIDNDEFVEWAIVHDNYYGTSKHFLEDNVKKGKFILLDIDVQGVTSIKKIYGKEAVSIFVMPPNMKILEQRLRERNTESDEKIKKRLETAKQEIAQASDFDYQITNLKLDEAFSALHKIIDTEFY